MDIHSIYDDTISEFDFFPLDSENPSLDSRYPLKLTQSSKVQSPGTTFSDGVTDDFYNIVPINENLNVSDGFLLNQNLQQEFAYGQVYMVHNQGIGTNFNGEYEPSYNGYEPNESIIFFF